MSTIPPSALISFLSTMGILGLVSGTLITFLSSQKKIRQRAAYFMAAPGYLATFAWCFLIANNTALELFSPWIIVSFLSVTLSMNIVHWTAAGEDRRRPALGVVAMAGLIVPVGYMILWHPLGSLFREPLSL